MSRSTVIYLVVLIAAAAGVTLILRRGEGLTAPPDVSGEWEVGRVSADSPPPEQSVGRKLVVEQSGRFVRLEFQNGMQLDAKLFFEPAAGASASADRGVTLRFRGKDWELTAEGKNVKGPLVCQLMGKERIPFTLSRPVAAAMVTAPRGAPTIPSSPAIPTATETADADPVADAP
jgi:hypothetical protein